MYLARIQDSNVEEPFSPSPELETITSFQAVSQTLAKLKSPHNADEFIEKLLELGYAIIPVRALSGALIFKGEQV